MTTITAEQRKAITEAGEAPVQLVDPETKTTDVLMTEGTYRQIRGREVEDLTPDEMTSHMWQVMKQDWSDPRMDIYDIDPESP
jgi:hypothetical protein